MDEARLAQAFTGLLGNKLAREVASDFVKIRRDFATKTLERASPGKFVETFVRCLQMISTGKHDAKPNIDSYLNTKVENDAALPDGLRFCGGRIARSMYTLRNKRNIAHKGEVDPNTFDLAFVHQGAAWIMAEMIRCASGISMEKAGALIELVQAPVGTLVEEIDGIRLVHADVSARIEILILLHSHYPDRVAVVDILKTMSGRTPASVRSRLSELRTDKLIFGDAKSGYRLTRTGYATAVTEIRRLQD